jgi:hypothetical protein
MINHFIKIGLPVLAIASLVIYTATSASGSKSEEDFPSSVRQYGCALFDDQYGEREITDTYFYNVKGGVVYWDTHFNVWVGPYGYWETSGVYHSRFFSEYRDFYRNQYHPYSSQHNHTGHVCYAHV